MSTATVEVEVASPFPTDKVFKVYNDFHNIAPKVFPKVFKSIETVEGDGDVPFTSAKYKQETIDASDFTYNYTFFEGDNLIGILDSIDYRIKIVPTDGGCVYKQTVIYNCKGDEKPSAEFLKLEKELYEKTYKAIEEYAAAHPEVY
ncbi:hypothetical protein L1987_56472 [Smallanthus sonchifolius]|uniref:Uncharacterized protein n=1 Tax=Smallanthus sonchifolius TaxID=185202 RepID=A0ACB9EDA7_9ASTR|nr:hypothetical protein L1987_56472 [Smallanthus sonchifolius]